MLASVVVESSVSHSVTSFVRQSASNNHCQSIRLSFIHSFHYYVHCKYNLKASTSHIQPTLKSRYVPDAIRPHVELNVNNQQTTKIVCDEL